METIAAKLNTLMKRRGTGLLVLNTLKVVQKTRNFKGIQITLGELLLKCTLHLKIRSKRGLGVSSETHLKSQNLLTRFTTLSALPRCL